MNIIYRKDYLLLNKFHNFNIFIFAYFFKVKCLKFL